MLPRLSPHRHFPVATSATNLNFPISALVVLVPSINWLLPARSRPPLCIWPRHKHVCCVGRGRGSPGRSEAERRGPPSSGQLQSQLSGASGQQGVALGCLAERETANRTPESDIRTPERHTHCDTRRTMSVLVLGGSSEATSALAGSFTPCSRPDRPRVQFLRHLRCQ